AQTQGWSPASCQTLCLDRHIVRAALGHSLGDAATGDGLWFGHDLLAAAARLAGDGRMGSPASYPSRPSWPGRADRLEPRGTGQFICAGEKGGCASGPNPTDRGKPGTKRHVVVDRRGTPLVCLISPANHHDSTFLERALDAIPAIKGRRGRPRFRPAKLHADKAYDSAACRMACQRRGII